MTGSGPTPIQRRRNECPRPSRRTCKPCVRLQSWPLVKCPRLGARNLRDAYDRQQTVRSTASQFSFWSVSLLRGEPQGTIVSCYRIERTANNSDLPGCAPSFQSPPSVAIPHVTMTRDDHGAHLVGKRVIAKFLGYCLDRVPVHAVGDLGVEKGEVHHDDVLCGLDAVLGARLPVCSDECGAQGRNATIPRNQELDGSHLGKRHN
jgi:hypothetical protein